MPKELVFVLDTSGSMEGFPIDKARETMLLALDGLYPQDTFNVITFAGDTQILFPQPVPATPENLRQAKNLLTHTKSEGGTEMMKAIRAALAPSDSEDHVRITCFMTDGQVGNDMEIIAEVRKYSQARACSRWASAARRIDSCSTRSPNTVVAKWSTSMRRRHSRRGKTFSRTHTQSLVHRCFNRLGWFIRHRRLSENNSRSLQRQAGDRFRAVTPAAGKGIIRLKGMMAGRELVREIPVELPEAETAHDVLATLWARRKVDDLMGQEMSALAGR